MRAGVGAINCTSCGAGLSVQGGGRVLVHHCGYCGAELDAQDSYRVLRKLAARERPRSPFEIGMTGPVRGVPFTVIGTLGMEEAGGGSSWVDHPIYSPTHGYLWLSWDHGTVTLSRKLRDLPRPPRISLADVEAAESPPVAWVGDTRFRYYESGRQRITFAEGEFNFRPEVGGSVDVVTLLGPRSMLHYVMAAEVEYETEELLDAAETLRSFGARPQPPGGAHPLALCPDPPFRRAAGQILLGFAVLNGLLWLFGTDPGVRVAEVRGVASDQVAELPFTVAAPPPLMSVFVAGDVSNAFAEFDIDIETAAGEPVTSFARAVEYYHGVEDGESWTEGNTTADARFRLAGAGEYVLQVTPAPGEAEIGGRVLRRYDVMLHSGTRSTFWSGLAALGFGIGAAILLGGSVWRDHQRMQGGDWDDD